MSCKCTIQRGKREGERCGAKVKRGSRFCGRHQNCAETRLEKMRKAQMRGRVVNPRPPGMLSPKRRSPATAAAIKAEMMRIVHKHRDIYQPFNQVKDKMFRRLQKKFPQTQMNETVMVSLLRKYYTMKQQIAMSEECQSCERALRRA